MDISGKASVLCPGCGKPVDKNASYCTSCGQRLFLDEDNGNSADPYLGKIIDDTFDVEAILGSGSMGVVYKARHRVLNCYVALKVLRQDFVTDRVILTRFQREAQAASALSHPNVIRIMHYGKTHLGAPYIAMECLDGIELASLVTDNFPLNPRRACSILYQTVQALMAAHTAGIIHRDLKPANIVIVQQNGQEVVKVLDFGIAKIADSESEGLTKEGSVCGTPAFMSPEQVLGQPVTPASDIFSLGSIIYYMLTCKLPFQGTSMVDMASAILTTDPPHPSQVRLDTYVDPHLEAICMKCLEKKLEFRYQSAAEIARDLEHAYNEIPEVAPEVKHRIVIGEVDESVDLSGETCCEIPAMPDDEEEDEEGATVVDMRAMPDDDEVVVEEGPKSSIAMAVSMVGQALSHALSLDSVVIGSGKIAPNESTRSMPAMVDEELPPDATEEQINARDMLIKKRKRMMIFITGGVVLLCAIIVIVVAIIFSDSEPAAPAPEAKAEKEKIEKPEPELKLSSLEIMRMTDLAEEEVPHGFVNGLAYGLVYGQADEEVEEVQKETTEEAKAEPAAEKAPTKVETPKQEKKTKTQTVKERMDKAAKLRDQGKKDKACSLYKSILKDPKLEAKDKTYIQRVIKTYCENSGGKSNRRAL